MADSLDIIFTPGYRTSFDDPDGSKARLKKLEVSGRPGTIQSTLRALPTAGMQPPPMEGATPVPGGQTLPSRNLHADVEFLNSLVSYQEQKEQPGEISKGVSRGYRQLKADFAAAGGTLADLFGFDETANAAYQKYSELMDEAAKFPAAVSRVEDAFTSPGAFINWAAGVTGEQIPIIASILVTGGVGSLLGRAAAKGLISATTAELAAKQAAQWGLRGATTGVIGGTAAIETGGMTGEQIEAGVPVQAGTNLLLGTTAGAAEAVSPILIGRMLGFKLPLAQKFSNKIASVMAGKGLLKRMGTGALVISGTEGGTEIFQEALALAAREFADENFDAIGPEGASRVLNAAAGGVLMGTLFGGFGGIRKQPHGAQEVEQGLPPEAEPMLALPPPQRQLPAPTVPGGVPTAPISPAALPGPEGMAMLPAPEESMFGAIREGRLTEPTILFTEQGRESIDPDAITARTGEITEALTSPETRTLAHRALLREVENQRLADFKRMFEIQQPSEKLGKMISLRSTLAEAENVSPAVEAKMQKLSKMIETQAAEEEVQIPKSTNLNERENARLAYLVEKDVTEGLNQREIDALEKLIAKDRGEKPVTRVAPTDEEISKLEKEIEQAMKNRGPLYSDTSGSSITGLTPEALQEAIAPVVNPNIPLSVLEHPAQMRTAPELQKYIMRSGRKIHGAYHNGQIYLFSRNLSKENAVKKYLHEAAHFGLHNVLPEAEFKAILRIVEGTNKSWVDAYLNDRQLDTTNPQERARGAEEYIAKIAEDGSDMPLLRKIIAIVRRWLRGVMPALRISDDEIRLILQGLGKELKGPSKQSNLGPNLKSYRYIMADDEYNNGYTMRILDRLRKEKRESVTPKYIRQLIKDMKMNDAEKSIIEETLSSLGLNQVVKLPESNTAKIPLSQFEAALKERIVPLTPFFTKKYAAYGLDRLGIQADSVEGGGTTIYEAPFDTGGSHHFSNTNYMGHVRWFTSGDWFTNRNSNAPELAMNIIEIQSDRSQRSSQRIKLSVEDLKTAIAENEKELNHLDTILNELQISISNTEPGAGLNPAYEVSDMTPARFLELGNDPVVNFSVRDIDAFIEIQDTGKSSLTPSEMAKWVRRMEEYISLQAVDLAEAQEAYLNQLQGITKGEDSKLEQMYPALFKRMLREEIRAAAQHGFKKLRVASVATVAKLEGWPIRTDSVIMEERAEFGRRYEEVLRRLPKTPAAIVDVLDDKYKLIAIRHNDLMKWAQAQYSSQIVVDVIGNTWHEIDIKPEYANKEVMAYFSDVAQGARNIGRALGEDYSLASSDVEKLSHMWRIKAETMALAPLQLVQRYGVEPLQRYINIVDKWARTKSEILSPADDVVGEWMELPKTEASNLSKALFEMTIESDEKGRKLTQKEEQAILSRNRIEGKALELYQSVNSSFVNILGRLEHGLKYNAARETLDSEVAATKFLTDWEATAGDSAARMNLTANLVVDPSMSINLTRRIESIEKEMGRLRNRNYFPYSRFGKYSVTSKNAKDETLGFWTFENAKAQENFFNSPEAVADRRAGVNMAMSVLTETQFAFLGMPPSFMETLSAELGLDKNQKDQLKEIFIRQSPGRAFLRHLIKRKGIEGFSQDAMRVYATYMMNAANHLARVENYVDMDKALTDFKGLKSEIEERTGDSRGLMTLFNSFQKHRNYIMNPGNELANLRALGFMWYLGFNVKSALVNMTQVPMVAYPYLASRYGDASSLSELTKAIKMATNVFRGKQGYDTTMDQLIARGIKEGFLDESLATELAGIAEGQALARMIPMDAAQRRLNQFSYYGAFLFRNAEKFARIVTFTAAAKLEQNKGGDIEAMFQAGKETVRSTMFEYAKWNRPAFMRGKSSVFFLFWTFMQNMAYISFGGQGAQTAVRVWIMLAMMAGLQGLPFAENLLDILDWGNEKVRRYLGLKGHYTDLRTEIRELLLTLTDNPDLIMHGLSRYYGLGPAHLLSLIGVPMPSVDTSGSLSLGRIVPGVKELVGSERNPDEKFGRTILEVLGPVFGMPYGLWRAVEDNDPDSWKRFERAMPTAIKAASKAGRYIARGEEEFRGGGAVAKFSPYDSQQRAEVIAQALGFTPSRVSQRYELRAAQQLMKEYFTVRRDVLMDDYAFAVRNRDREGVADVRQAIKEYNMSVPHPALRIDSAAIKRSSEARKKGAQQRETLTPSQKMFRPTFRQVEKAYPDGSKLE